MCVISVSIVDLGAERRTQWPGDESCGVDRGTSASLEARATTAEGLSAAVPVHHRADDECPAGLALLRQAYALIAQLRVLGVLADDVCEGANTEREREAALVIVRSCFRFLIVVFLVFLFAN